MNKENPIDESNSDYQSFGDLFGSTEDFFALINGATKEEERLVLSPEDEEIKTHFIKQFFIKIYGNLDVRNLNLRELVQDVPMVLGDWKQSVRKVNASFPEKNMRLIESVSVQDLAKVAEEEFKKAQKELGGSIPGSSAYNAHRNWTDYWSRVEQITKAAAEEEKRNN